MLGIGMTGIAFDWTKQYPLPDNFSDNTVGNINNNQNTVIKITIDKNESELVKNLIKIGGLKGLVNYRWIKSIDKPNNLSHKKLYLDEGDDIYPYVSLICMDKLKPLSPTDSIIASILNRLYLEGEIKSYDEAKVRSIYGSYDDLIIKFKYFGAVQPPSYARLQHMIKALFELYEKIDKKILKSFGIDTDYLDLNGENIGYNDSGELLLFDISVPNIT
jgi:hypothetical protein